MQVIESRSPQSLPNIVATSRWHTLAWLLVFLGITGAIQLYIPYPMDADTAYHAAVGQLIRQHGILHAFPWTPYSWLADHYADKELLFHLLFVPLAGLEWTAAARVVGVLAGSLVLLASYLVLRAEGVRSPGLWALIPLVASHSFIYRFSIVRPHLLSIALVFVVLWAAARGRLLILAAASAVYPWAYVAWHLPLILVFIAEAARLLAAQPIRWKPAVAALAGMLTGVALHPNGMNLVRLTWIQIVEVLLRNAWGAKAYFELGREFLPETADGWARGLAICVLMVGAALILAWRQRQNDSVALAFVLTALAFAALTLKSGRFLEYFVPFSAAALALASRSISWRFLPQTIIAISVLYTVSLNSGYLLAFGQSPNVMPPATAAALREKIPAGAQVFTTDWGSTGTFMLALPDRRFIVALDPTFFYEKDPELYRLWFRIPREAPPDSADLIRLRFQSRYVLSGYRDGWEPFFDRLLAEPGVRSYFIDGLWLLFDLGEPSRPVGER
jgi:hypothetical protein